MSRWKTGMTLSQRRRYNESMRLYKLRKALHRGHIPQPRKELTIRMKREYELACATKAVAMPADWMDDEMLAGIREDQRVVRAKVRDMLPADYADRKHGKQKIKIITDALLSGKTTIEKVLSIE